MPISPHYAIPSLMGQFVDSPHKLDVLDINLEENKISIRVDCSKGTYIRTLCDDIGRELGCFAHMSKLERTKSGRFDIKDAYTLSQIEEMLEKGDMGFLVPVDVVFEEYERLTITEKKAKKM